MKKVALFIAIFSSINPAVYSQDAGHTTSTAHQVLTMNVRNVLEFTFTGTDAENGSTVLLPFNTMSDYTQGVSSSEQVLRIRSNKKFGVEVKANAPYFDYSGNTSPAPSMPVDNVLNLEISQNATGGNLKAPFTQGKYVSVSNNSKTIVDNCRNGGDQHFGIKYKAAPGITYPVGTYTVDIVYTATQQ